MGKPPPGPVRAVLGFLGSLKLTVTLLAMSMFLVLAGTVAQVDRGIWTVVEEYFRCWFTLIPAQVFFPRDWKIPGEIPFPGGWTLETLLLINLMVSHSQRISLQARGTRLVLGLAVSVVGVGVTWLVIGHGFDHDSSAGKVAPFWRIMRQLIYATGAATILFGGCRLIFGRKAGIVLLHSGLIFMLVHEVFTGLVAVEAQMRIYEGQASNYGEAHRWAELAVIDPSDPRTDDVTVITHDALSGKRPVIHPDLPFEAHFSGRFMKNAALKEDDGRGGNPATMGLGLQYVARAAQEAAGADSSGGVDLPAVYVELKEKGTGRSLGTWLFAVELTRPQELTVGGKTYQLALRWRRVYKPYSVYLYDLRVKRYQGTGTAQDYSAFVRLSDPELGLERDVRIWMNNPLRYRGDTLYQSGFDERAEAYTVLQVVDNESWMVPYVGCMIVAVGLLGQFLLHLAGFLRRRAAA